VGDDGGSVTAGEIEAYTARCGVGGVQTDRNSGRGLTGGGVGTLAGGHGHDLQAHDHETVVKDPHHHDEEDGQDEGKLDEGLALTPAARASQLLQV